MRICIFDLAQFSLPFFLFCIVFFLFLSCFAVILDFFLTSSSVSYLFLDFIRYFLPQDSVLVLPRETSSESCSSFAGTLFGAYLEQFGSLVFLIQHFLDRDIGFSVIINHFFYPLFPA